MSDIKKPKYEIAIVDDHRLFADALKNTLAIYKISNEVNIFLNGNTLLTFLENNCVDVILLDLGIKEGMNGFETLKKLKEYNKKVKVIIISMHTQGEFISKAKAYGANAYISKETTAFELAGMIRYVMQNGSFKTNIEEIKVNPFHNLTNIEKKVVMMLLEGMNNQEIADSMYRSKSTIDSHRKNVYQKLNISSILELVKLGIKYGMITDKL